jgi:hypothetical protein
LLTVSPPLRWVELDADDVWISSLSATVASCAFLTATNYKKVSEECNRQKEFKNSNENKVKNYFLIHNNILIYIIITKLKKFKKM